LSPRHYLLRGRSAKACALFVMFTVLVPLITLGAPSGLQPSFEEVASASARMSTPFVAHWLPKGFQSTPVESHIGAVSVGSTSGPAMSVHTSEAINYIQARGNSTILVIAVKSSLYPKGYWASFRDAKGYQHSISHSRFIIYARTSASSTLAMFRVHGYQVTAAGIDVSETSLVKFCIQLKYRD
jgi:hypothetical protein